MKDYNHRKAVFDAHTAKRKELGSNGGFRSSERPDEIPVLTTEWGDLPKAREFTQWGNLNGNAQKCRTDLSAGCLLP